MSKRKKTVPAVKPANLENVPTDELLRELMRRDLAVAAITPEDIVDQWNINQAADATGLPPPSKIEISAALKCVQVWLNKTVFENEPAFEWGPASDACELIAAWRKEGGSK